MRYSLLPGTSPGVQIQVLGEHPDIIDTFLLLSLIEEKTNTGVTQGEANCVNHFRYFGALYAFQSKEEVSC